MFYDERELVSRQGIFGSVFKRHARPIRYFSYMHEDLSLIFKNSIKKRKDMLVHANNPSTEGAETDIPLGSLVRQCNLYGKFQANEKPYFKRI